MFAVNNLLPSSWENKHFKGNVRLDICFQSGQFTVETLIWQYVKFIGRYTMISVCRQALGARRAGVLAARLTDSDRRVTILHINGRRSIIRLTQWL